MMVRPWQATATKQLADTYPCWNPNDDLTSSLATLQRHGLPVNQVQRIFPGSYTITDGLQPVAHADVVHALRAQAVETVSRDPFDLYVTLLGQFGSLNFDTSQLQGAPFVNVPDLENHFASNDDVVLVRQSELSQLRTAAQMATNAASLTRHIVELMSTTAQQPASDNQ